MDSILSALFIVAANTLITYFLLRRQEQRLQYEVFEQQQKFSAMHPKRVEVLQTLYEKYNNFVDTFYEWSQGIEADIKAGKKVDIAHFSVDEPEEVDKKLSDFWHYLTDNRLFLSNDSVEKISGIFLDANLARIVINLVRLDPNSDITSYLFDKTTFVKNKESSGQALAVIWDMEGKVLRQVDVLEELYKSTAGIK